ncbi:glutamine amidotransferase-related protein [Shewanella salipaludis]|uniref:GMP synthase n=1 Tax=Shewanella salipaludis TaxID=2723052 RepID=A0A972FYC8_9GAMM|nr:GMP synthase [Shewanella salipaludis]NMH64156.1 GMP synthase [Shewanella salipaludis]
MKIGILQCDDVSEPLLQAHGNYPEMFHELLTGLDETIGICIYRVMDSEYPAAIDECDAYIISGSRHSVNEDLAWIRTLEAYVRELYLANKKLVGICFGHQLMAKALGGEVIQSPKGWGVGVATTEITRKQPWMTQDEERMSLLVSHQDQVSVLPAAAQVLAASDFCPFYMVQIDAHFLGIQGHPEFSKAYSRDLMEARRHRIPAGRIAQGLESLSQPLDNRRVTQWLIDFIRHDAAD